jgi:two-component system OmpR family sensor kinase
MKNRKLGLLTTILVPTQLALGLALAALGFFMYLGFSSQLYRGMDAVLKSKAEGLIESIDTFWQLEGKDKKARAEFAAFAKTWVSEKSPDSILVNAVVQISDESGAVIATSRNINLWPEKPLRAGQTAMVSANFADGKTVRLRVYAEDVPEKRSPGYRILVGQTVAITENAINNLRAALIVGVPLVLLFLALTITIIVRRALQPLGDIVGSMERIGAKNLSERFSVEGSTREIVALKKSFDTMLDRLDGAFTEERAFIADLSHQIKTPLAIVKGQLETTLRRERSRDEYEETLHSGLEEIDTITRLIEKLLLLARYDSREIRPDFRKFDLAAEIRSLTEDFSPLARARDLGVSIDAETGAFVVADRIMVRQIFMNLFDNAVKYANPGTDILISVRSLEGYARFSIRDFGVVIDPDDIPHLFERFRRFDRTGAQGFGLGLSIVDSIALQLGAKVCVSSDAFAGTEFTLVFPPD